MRRKDKHPHLRKILSISQSFDNQISQNVIEQIFKECNGNIDLTISTLSSTTDSWNSTSNVINDSYKYICQRLHNNDIDEDTCKEVLISNSFDIEKSLIDIQNIFNIIPQVAGLSDHKNKSTKQPTLTTSTNNDDNHNTTTDAALLDQLAQKFIDNGYFIDDNLFTLSDTFAHVPNNKEGDKGIIMIGEASGVPTEDQLYMQNFYHELFDDFIASEDSSVNDSTYNDTTCDSISPIEKDHNSDPHNSDPLIWSDMVDTRTTQEVALDYLRELFAHTEYSDSLLSDILVMHAYDVDAAVSTLCQINDTDTNPSTFQQSAEPGKYIHTSISFADAVKAPSYTPSALVKYAQDPHMKHNKKNLIKQHILSKFTITDTTTPTTSYPLPSSYTPLFQHTNSSATAVQAYTQTPSLPTTAITTVRKSTSLPSLSDLNRTNKPNHTSSSTTSSSSSAKTRAPPGGAISHNLTAINTDHDSWQVVRYKEAVRLVSTFQQAGKAIDSGTQQGRGSIGYSIAGHLLSEGKRAKARYVLNSLYVMYIMYCIVAACLYAMYIYLLYLKVYYTKYIMHPLPAYPQVSVCGAGGRSSYPYTTKSGHKNTRNRSLIFRSVRL